MALKKRPPANPAQKEALPHLDEKGAARMVDVGPKARTHRVAVAEAFVRLLPSTVALLSKGEVAKGDALAVARIAGIAATKKTPDLIPLAHPLSLSHVAVEVKIEPSGARIRVRAETHGPTGVEMEAMTGASVAALALYDMVKKNDRGAVIEHVQLMMKSGGNSGTYERS